MNQSHCMEVFELVFHQLLKDIATYYSLFRMACIQDSQSVKQLFSKTTIYFLQQQSNNI